MRNAMRSGLLAIVATAGSMPHRVCFGVLGPVDAVSVLRRCKHPVSDAFQGDQGMISHLRYMHALRLLMTDTRCFAFVGIEDKHDVVSVSVCRPMDNVHVLHVCVVSPTHTDNIAHNDQRRRNHILALKQWHSSTFKAINLVLTAN